MAQNKFLSLMYEALKNKDNVIFGCEVKEVKRDPDGFYLLRDQVG
jgi:L-2-hydroxyglutarate oxidase LhgO